MYLTADNESGECYDLTENQAEKNPHIYVGSSREGVGGLGGIPPIAGAGAGCQHGDGTGCYDDCKTGTTCIPTDGSSKGRPGVCYDNDQINMYIINRTPYTFIFQNNEHPGEKTATSLQRCMPRRRAGYGTEVKSFKWYWGAGPNNDPEHYGYACQFADARTLIVNMPPLISFQMTNKINPPKYVIIKDGRRKLLIGLYILGQLDMGMLDKIMATFLPG